MKKRIALAAVAGLALVSCGSGDTTAEPAPTVTVTETVTATPEPERTEPAVDEDAEVEEPSAEDIVNERGNVPMPENSGGIRNVDTDEVAVQWEASDVSTDVECTAPYAEVPAGVLLSVDFDVEVFDEANSLIPEGFHLFTGDFYVMDPDGEVSSERLGTAAAFSCLPESQTFPDSGLRGGNTATGTLVFESPVESGYLVFRDIYTNEHYEWEF